MMSYQVLARKWRPRAFQDVIGQEAILRMLANALNLQRLHHAYLFTGTRGVGKTTLARILAKCLNCEQGITATPCETCATCQAIDTGRFIDLFEIDAASRTKVEDTRELLENVPYPPAQGRYKIYLIDEVHMLSGHSFNALLKTLEEPPSHVVFILATTEPKRLPITILSRCLQFHLKAISPEQLTQQLQKICQAENIPNETAALEKLAVAANGSVRDALSLLDQTIAYCGGTITLAEVENMLGSIPQQALLPLLEALSDDNAEQLLSCINRLASQAADFNQVLAEFLILLHEISLAQVAPATGNATIQSWAKRLSPQEVQLYYQIALIGRRDLPLAPTPKLGFEMTMLRMKSFKRVEVNAASPSNPLPHPPPIAKSALGERTSTETPSSAAWGKAGEGASDWQQILSQLTLSGMAHALAANCSLTSLGDNKVVLALAASHEPMRQTKLIERIEQALCQHLGRKIQLDIQLTSAELETPTKQQERTKAQKHAAATQAVMEDPFIKDMMDVFDATIVKDSIQAVE